MSEVIDVLAVAIACGRPVLRVSPAPPAPIVARTGCGTYEIRPDGRVRPHPSGSSPAWAPHAVSHPAPGVWAAHPHGRLAVYRAGRLLWQSRIRVASDEVVVHGSSIAFGLYGRNELAGPTLWMARVGGREFRVAGAEDPIAWTAGGLVTLHGNQIRVRNAAGSVVRTLALGRSPTFDTSDGTVVFVRRDGALMRTDGQTQWRLAKGLPRSAWVTVLGNRMLQVTGPRRTLYFRSDGSLLGSSAEPSGGVVGLPGQRAVAFVTNVRRQRGGAALMGTNVVELLDARGRLHRLYERAVPYASCGEWAYVSYFRHRLLYVDDEGPAAILDPTGKAPPIDLAQTLRPLQPRLATRARLYADWLANWS
jgi:hypothetical protein